MFFHWNFENNDVKYVKNRPKNTEVTNSRASTVLQGNSEQNDMKNVEIVQNTRVIKIFLTDCRAIYTNFIPFFTYLYGLLA